MTASVVTPEMALPDWFKICRQWMVSDALFLDTETTGRNERAEIVELSVVHAKGKPLIDTLV
jgi:DNA polymerase-3 subunit epsilon